MSSNRIKFHTESNLTRAAGFKSYALSDYDETCERCGRDLKRKHKRPKAKDGMKLCGDCRGTDKAYRQMRTAGRFIETSDEELAALEEAS